MPKIPNKQYLIAVAAAVLYGVTQISAILYIWFLYYLLIFFLSIQSHSKANVYSSYIELLIFSILLPDNYTVVVVSFLLLGVLLITKDNGLFKFSLMNFLMVIYLLFNLTLNWVQPLNFLFSVIYMLPFFLLFSFFQNIFPVQDSYNRIIYLFYMMIAMQASATLSFAITHISVIQRYNDLDWVVGTFGAYQSSILMVLLSFGALLLLNDYICYKNKRSIKYAIVSLLLALSTSSISYTVFLFAAILTVIFCNGFLSLKQKLLIVVISVLSACLFFFVSPSWATRELPKLMNVDYFKARVTKILAYEDVFVSLPSEYGIEKFFFGVGLGQYSSRAALTCSGEYIDSYEKFFPISSSIYTDKYITPFNASSTGGITSRASSSIIAIQGELGFIGLLFFSAFFIKTFFRNRSFGSAIMLLFFLEIAFFENTLEFAKYTAILSIALMCCEHARKHIETVRTEPPKNS